MSQQQEIVHPTVDTLSNLFETIAIDLLKTQGPDIEIFN